MKTDIHPNYNTGIKVVCACGNDFVTGSTLDSITVEVCSECHPFYTGKQKLVDTAKRVDKFQARMAKAEEASKNRKGKKAKRAKADAKKAETAKKAPKKAAKEKTAEK